MKFKRVKAGHYESRDGKYRIEKCRTGDSPRSQGNAAWSVIRVDGKQVFSIYYGRIRVCSIFAGSYSEAKDKVRHVEAAS
jgi:hypothetical protein